MTKLKDLLVKNYILKPGDQVKGTPDITLDRVAYPEGYRWAIRRGSGVCMNKSGKWELEPLPSERDNAFFARCRWITAREAMSFYKRTSIMSKKIKT